MSFELCDVTVRRGDRTLLDGVTCTLPDTGVTVVAGASGSGKSTLLRLLNRLSPLTSGSITWRGQPLSALEPQALRRRVAMVFQRPALFGGTVLDNLRAVRPELPRDEAADLLATLGLGDDLLEQIATDLSGGEAQRVCLARSLTTSPEVILADEPTSALDPRSRRLLEDLAVRMATGEGAPAVGWIWVTHDEHQIERLADHVALLEGGRLLASGPLDELRHSPEPRVRAALGPRRPE